MRLTGPISVLLGCVAIFIRIQAFAVQTVNLAWNASLDTNILGYVVYYGTTSRSYNNAVYVGNTTNATIPGITENVPWYFAVAGHDAAGSESQLSNEIFHFVSTVLEPTIARPSFRIHGNGVISPDLSTRDLSIGKNYTVAAIPASGQAFAGWSGSTNSPSARLTFRMARVVALEAHFIPSPFIPIAGSYTGLFAEDDAVRQGRSGSFSVSVSTYGTYSGQLRIEGVRYVYSGRLGVDCQATTVIPRGGSNALTLQFRLGTGDEADQLFGHVSDGVWMTTLQGDRAVFNALTNPAPYAGNYNLLLPGQSGDPSLPAGDGFGSLRITTAGKLSFSGTLADNSRISQSVAISKHGQWPFYIPLYKGKGSILSWLTFENRTNDDLNGLLSWIKPADTNALLYSGGFTNVLNTVGAVYVAPVGNTNPVVSFTNARVRFSGGELATDFTNAVTFALMNRVVNLSTNKFSMIFSRSNGRFYGRVQDPQNGLSRVFKGAVLQKANAGYGYLVTTNQSSRVVLTP